MCLGQGFCCCCGSFFIGLQWPTFIHRDLFWLSWKLLMFQSLLGTLCLNFLLSYSDSLTSFLSTLDIAIFLFHLLDAPVLNLSISLASINSSMFFFTTLIQKQLQSCCALLHESWQPIFSPLKLFPIHQDDWIRENFENWLIVSVFNKAGD